MMHILKKTIYALAFCVVAGSHLEAQPITISGSVGGLYDGNYTPNGVVNGKNAYKKNTAPDLPGSLRLEWSASSFQWQLYHTAAPLVILAINGANTPSNPPCTSLSSWFPTLTVTGNCDIVAAAAPVELTAFQARIEPEGVQLTWATASELNNAGFEVQKSMDLSTWEVLTFMEGNGTTDQARQYEFLDPTALTGTAYYRLKQIDWDGAFVHSHVVEVQADAGSPSTLHLYPNPANAEVHFVVPQMFAQEDYTVEVYDLMGRKVMEESRKGGAVDPLTVSGLQNGFYLLKVPSYQGAYHGRFQKR